MDEPRNGRGSLPLLLRLSMLRARQRGGGSLAERGYALAVALIAAFVLLLGVGALASRGQLGFIGQVFQVQNRQARDVAESAIAEFINTMNQERNRHLLIAGTTDNWNSARWAVAETDFRNICTAFNNDLTPVNAAAPQYTDPDQSAITRFTVGATRDLDPNDATRGQFTIENIEFLNEDRDSYVNAAGAFLDYTDPEPPNNTISYGELYRTGSQRSLIRVTVVGSIQQANGRASTARVAREFEVVPKCCKRSFGQNVFGGRNWGRDDEPCGGDNQNNVPGLIAGMNGGLAGGSNNVKQIVQEDGSLVTEAACWAGNDDPTQPSDLSNDPTRPNTTCTDGTSGIANISFLPTTFNFVAPVYNHPSGLVPAAPDVNVQSGRDFLYFDIDEFNARGGVPANNLSAAGRNAFSGVILSTNNGATLRRINGLVLNDPSPDPCYVVADDNDGDGIADGLPNAANGRPYYTVNCRVTSINPSGNRRLYIDTSVAKINIFFVGNGDYGIGSGNAGTYRIHGDSNGQFPRANLSVNPVQGDVSNCVNTNNVAGCLIRWPAPGPITQATRLNTFLELCADRGGYDCDFDNDDDEEYSVRRLLNFYASGTGSFTINGTSTGVGYNIYAPFGSVRVNGGGFADNLMGQIWTNNLTLNGNVKIQTFSGGGGQATGGGQQGFAFGRALIDFVARSFTQSSGFGL